MVEQPEGQEAHDDAGLIAGHIECGGCRKKRLALEYLRAGGEPIIPEPRSPCSGAALTLGTAVGALLNLILLAALAYYVCRVLRYAWARLATDEEPV